jgi:hypothetical protein
MYAWCHNRQRLSIILYIGNIIQMLMYQCACINDYHVLITIFDACEKAPEIDSYAVRLLYQTNEQAIGRA